MDNIENKSQEMGTNKFHSSGYDLVGSDIEWHNACNKPLLQAVIS